MGDAEDLALLGIAPAALLADAGCSVAAFVDAHELMPGRARAIEMSALYRMYLEWGTNPVSPMAFARRVHALGFKSGRKRKTCPLMANAASAARLRRWLELNPQPFGWANEFRSRFWGKGDK